MVKLIGPGRLEVESRGGRGRDDVLDRCAEINYFGFEMC